MVKYGNSSLTISKSKSTNSIILILNHHAVFHLFVKQFCGLVLYFPYDNNQNFILYLIRIVHIAIIIPKRHIFLFSKYTFSLFH